MCRRGGGKMCVARHGSFNQVIFATIWPGSGQHSNKTLLPLFVRSQVRCRKSWWLCCDVCPGPFCGQSPLRLGMGGGGVGDVGRYFRGRQDGLLLLWDLGQSHPGLAPGDTDGGDAGTGTGATEGVEKCAWRDTDLSTRLFLPRSGRAVDSIATRLFSPFL